MRSVLVTAVVMAGIVASDLFRRDELPLPPPDGPLPTAKPYGLGKPAFAQLASASCAASACHGGTAGAAGRATLGPRGVGGSGQVGSEHTTWAPEVFPEGPTDPHARAHAVLFNAVSVRIGKKLGIAAPYKDAGCLKCHSVEGVQPEAVSEGVGCGACHGPAEKWLAAHVQPGWKGLANRDKWEQFGFVPAENLVARSLNCVGCHVGDADREVNHDMIAAGHPRLAFEYTRFHFDPKYRQHWQEKTPQPDFEVRAWVAGQAATLRAATDLLRVRAERAAADDPKAVWPEFAGLSCFACHQKLDPEGPRGWDPAGRRPLGVAPWEVWSNATSGIAAKLCPEAFPGTVPPELRELAALRKVMEKRSPDPKTVAMRAARAVAELDAWLADLQANEDRNRSMRVAADTPRKFAHAFAANALSADRTRLADHDWDSLATHYLGTAAMYHASGGKRTVPDWTDPLRGLGARLRFTTGYNSPATFGRKERDDVRDRFGKLFDVTRGSGEKP